MTIDKPMPATVHGPDATAVAVVKPERMRGEWTARMRGLVGKAKRPAKVKAVPAKKIGRRQLGDAGALAVLYAQENLYVTENGTWAGFWLKDSDWFGLNEDAHDRSIRHAANRFAELVGHRVYLRGTHNPWPVAGIRDAMEELYPDPYVPVNGAPGFADPGVGGELGGEIDIYQRYLVAVGARRPFWFCGVRLFNRPVPREHLGYLLGAPIPERLDGLAVDRRLYDRVSAIIAGNGLGGLPVNEKTLAWVFRGSIGAGLETVTVDPSRTMSFEDTIGLDGPIRSVQAPFGAYTEIHGIRYGQQVTRYVSVLRARPLESVEDTEEIEPWLSWATGLSELKVEAAFCADIVPAESLRADAVKFRRIQSNQIKHYAEHGLDAPDETVNAEIRATEVVSELSSRNQTLNTGFLGQLMFAVSAGDQDELAGRVELFKRLAKAEQNIDLDHEPGQWADYRRFIPGEDWSLPKVLLKDSDALDGYVTAGPVAFLGAGMPHASTACGDPCGLLLGRVGASNDVAFHDPFGGSRRNRTNSTVLIGSPGSSKSATMGLMSVFMARAGIPGVLYEAAGTMRPWTQLKSLEGSTREIPLTQDSPPGILQPGYLIPDPDRGDYETQAKYDTARLQVDAERVSLTMTAVLQCVDPGMLKDHPDMRGEIREVCAEFPHYGTSMREVLARFDATDPQGGNENRRRIARQLKSRAHLPDGKLIFPGKDTDDAAIHALLTDALFTLVSMPGMEAPPKVATDPENWTPGQLAARPIQTLGNRFAALSIWTHKGRSWFSSDELGIATGGAEHGSYMAFLRRVLYDSRKSNSAIVFAAQTVATMMAIEADLAALVGAAMVSRTSRENAVAALPLLGIAPGSGLEDRVPGYADGQVAYSGFDGKVREIQIDQAAWTQELIDAANTTPAAPKQVLQTAAGAGVWA